MTPQRYLQNYCPGSFSSNIESLADFLQAVANGEDLWDGGNKHAVYYSTMNGSGEYQALKALGWSAGSDYGRYGCEDMFIYNPHPTVDSEDNS